MALIPVFIFWVGRQERLGRPAIIPVSYIYCANAILTLIRQNSLWRNTAFTAMCLAVFFTW
jgi:hypothetical protein